MPVLFALEDDILLNNITLYGIIVKEKEMSDETIAMSTIEAARELRCHPNTLLRWVAEGKIPYLRIGRKLLYSRSEISKLVAAGQSNQPPAAGVKGS